MSKYSSKQLKEMAQTFLVDYSAGGGKSFRLIMEISMRTGVAPDSVVAHIVELSNA